MFLISYIKSQLTINYFQAVNFALFSLYSDMLKTMTVSAMVERIVCFAPTENNNVSPVDICITIL
jgi:hypothetical protein